MGTFDTDSIVNPTTIIPEAQKLSLRLYLVRHGESEANQRGIFAGQLDSPLTERGVSDAKSLGERSDFFILQQPVDSQLQRADRNERELHPFFFHRVYSSDLIRAHDTCRLILEGLRSRQSRKLTNGTDNERTEPGIDSLLNDIRLDNRLRERSYGTLQGMPWSSDRNYTDKMWLDTHEKDESPPIFETDNDIWIRVKKFLLSLIEDEELLRSNRDSMPRMESSDMINSSIANKETMTKHILITSHGGVLRQILMRLVDVDKLKRMGALYDPQRKNRLITPNASLSILDLSLECGHQYEIGEKELGEERTGLSYRDGNLRKNHDNHLEGINVDLILLANTDHLKDVSQIHDD